MKKGIFEEIMPTLDLPSKELEEFASAVLERFANPFIKHYLLSISLNSTSKFKTRVLPSLLEYANRKGALPKVLTFSLAALLAFYKGTEIQETSLIGSRPGNEYKINDDMSVLNMFKTLWSAFDGSREGTEALVTQVLGKQEMWGTDLNTVEGLTSAVANDLFDILDKGMHEAIEKIIE